MNISIIIPVYNVSNYIEKSIKSICSQTLQQDIECIIIDDCSPDDSIERAKNIIKNYKGDITFKIIEHNHNKGLAAARNTGMQYATGKYVLHLDSDDYYEPNMLEVLYKTAIKEQSDIIICDFFQNFINKETKLNSGYIKDSQECVRYLIRHQYNNIAWNIWNKLIKRSLFTDNNIKWIEGLDYGEDLLICTKLFCYAQTISKINIPLYHYTRYNITSYSNQSFKENDEKCIPVLVETESFLKERGLYDTYKNEVNYRKVAIKSSLLNFGDKNKRSYYSKLFPESFKYIWKTPDISIANKIKLYVSQINLSVFIFIEDKIINRKYYSTKQ